MRTVRDVLHQVTLADPEGSVEDWVEGCTEIIVALPKSEQRLVLRTVLAELVRQHRRNTVHQIERKVAASVVANYGLPPSEFEPVQSIPDIYAPMWHQMLFVPGHGMVGFADMTVLQWEARIQMLVDQQKGIGSTINFYESVVKTIVDAGVLTMREVIEAH